MALFQSSPFNLTLCPLMLAFFRIMRPNLPHTVYTPEHAICHGGHFYAIGTMQDSMFGLVHSFIAGNLVTNTDHVASRLLLRRMAHFYHGAYVLGLINEEGRLGIFQTNARTDNLNSIDPTSDHVPDLREFKSFLDIVTLCNAVILINALDGRTYQATELESDSDLGMNLMPMEERLGCIYARGKCVDLLNWIDSNYGLQDPTTQDMEIEPCHPMMVAYFRQQTSAIKVYKLNGERDGIWGSDTALHCSGVQLADQLNMAHDVFPRACDNNPFPSLLSTSLAWQGPTYDVVARNGHPSSRGEYQQSASEFDPLLIGHR